MFEMVVIAYVVFVVVVLAIFCHRFYEAASYMKGSDQRLNENMQKALLEAQRQMKEKGQEQGKESR